MINPREDGQPIKVDGELGAIYYANPFFAKPAPGSGSLDLYTPAEQKEKKHPRVYSYCFRTHFVHVYKDILVYADQRPCWSQVCAVMEVFYSPATYNSPYRQYIQNAWM